MIELPFQTFIIVDIIEEVGIKVWPLLKGIFFAEQAWRHVLGDEGRLNEDSARAAHRIDEVCVTLPARQENHASGEDFVQRCLDTLLTVTAPVERLTA